MSNPLLCIVVPCFNEEETLEATNKVLCATLKQYIQTEQINEKSFICYVDDGSRDSTWKKISLFTKENEEIRGLKLSTNFGHQSAILAGIDYYKAECDCTVTIDADLQDDVNAIKEMIAHYRKGADIVHGVRAKRKSDSFFKRQTALAFYKFMKLLGVNVVYNSADYRLTSRRVNHELSNYSEVNLFLRGVFPIMGFKQEFVYYDRSKREAGETKYPFRKMISFAFEGISSFSVKPLRLITISGLLIFAICFLLSIYVLISYLQGYTERGWSSTVLPSYLLGGLQIFFLGIIGEYLGKIYKEIKRRPRYIIEKDIKHGD